MSEPKRPPLQSLDLPDTLGHTAKKADKAKQLAPSFRFELTLAESNEFTCPEYNYAQLLKNAEKKRKKELKGKDENNINGLDPFASDDEDQLKEIAKRFETKYGNTNSAKRKRHKYHEYLDLGAGYDESDSFIDNTDAYDEIVPEEMTTAHGGFYINCGALEFKQADGNSFTNNNNDNNDNDNDDEDESSVEEAEDADSPKRSDKRDNSSSEDEDIDKISEHTFKKVKVDENDKKSNHESVNKKKHNQLIDVSNKRKNEDSVENNNEDADSKNKKFKSDTSKKLDIKKFVKSSANGIDLKKGEYKKSDKVDASIESVVNASRAEDESSRDTLDSGKSRGLPGSESECDDIDKGETRTGLPEGLPEDVKETINKLKIHGESIKKGKTFSDAINHELLSLEKKLRSLSPPNIRQQVYEHLVPFLHCSKNTLTSRAKKLTVQEAENSVKDPVQRLKTIVERIMPSVIEKYNKECQRIADEKNLENQSADLENDRNAQKLLDSMPRKRFPWTEETKKLIFDIANARRSYFKIAKPRKQSVEEFVSSFLKSEVLTLWPPGWMDMRSLLKYVNLEPPCKKKQKPKEVVPAPILGSTSGINVQNCNSRIEVVNTTCERNQDTATNKPMNMKNSVPSSLEITKVEPQKLEHHHSMLNFQNVIKTTPSTTEIKPVIKFKMKQESTANHVPTMKLEPQSQTQIQIQSQNQNQTQTHSQSQSQNQSQPHIQSQAQSQSQSQTNVNDWGEFSDHSKKIMAQFTFDLPAIKHDLSITPVNDYQKMQPKMEVKKDVVSITPYNDPSVIVADSHFVSTSSRFEPMDLKNHLEERDPLEILKAEKRKLKKRDRYMDNRHKPGEIKKRREEESKDVIVTKEGNTLLPQMSKEEQEQRQIEETMAATNMLSQLINDCPVQGVIEDAAEPIDADKEVQEVHDVMKSLKELEKLRERSSPSHSPMRVSQNSSIYLGNFQEDYHRFYQKKEDKMRIPKKEGQW